MGFSMSKSKIFFMHVAKTGGSYVNDVFIKSIGAENCLVHCEQIMQDESAFRELLAQKSFVSGHVYYKDWVRLAGQLKPEFLTVSVVRRPLEHLKSHLLFTNNFNKPQFKKMTEALALGEDLMRALDEVALVDFSNYHDIKQFLCSMSPKSTELFNNCQSRYFLCEANMNSTLKLETSHINPLLSALPQFDLIGLNENIDFFLTRLQHMSGIRLDIHKDIVNKTISNFDFDIHDEKITRVLKQNTEIDELLYQTVLAQTNRALSERVVELEDLVLTANERASAAGRVWAELRNQLACARDELQRRALSLDAVQAQLALISAERDAVVTSLPWRMIRKVGRMSLRTGLKPSPKVFAS
jgi:hypothetical protein